MRKPVSFLFALVAACAATHPAGVGSQPPMASAPPSGAGSVRAVVFPPSLERPSPALEAEIVAAAADLWSSDFRDYAAAGRKLVEIGEPAVPYLGYFGDVPKELSPGHRVGVVRIVLDAILDEMPPEGVETCLGSPYRDVRAGAAAAAGRRGLAGLAPALLDLLEDPELPVRRAAAAGLRRLSDRFYGYRADASERERRAAAALWREFWRE